MLLRAWANFSDCGFSRRVFSVLGRSFPFPSLIGFFPSFCQALAEDRVTTPTGKKKKMAGGADGVLPVTLSCPLPLRRTHPPTLLCCVCADLKEASMKHDVQQPPSWWPCPPKQAHSCVKIDVDKSS